MASMRGPIRVRYRIQRRTFVRCQAGQGARARGPLGGEPAQAHPRLGKPKSPFCASRRRRADLLHAGCIFTPATPILAKGCAESIHPSIRSSKRTSPAARAGATSSVNRTKPRARKSKRKSLRPACANSRSLSRNWPSKEDKAIALSNSYADRPRRGVEAQP